MQTLTVFLAQLGERQTEDLKVLRSIRREDTFCAQGNFTHTSSNYGLNTES